MVILFFALTSCADDLRDDVDVEDDDDDTYDTPIASYDLPDGVTGFVGDVTWYADAATAACEGRTVVTGTRDDTVCPSCDFAFTYTATELERTGDPACTPLERLLWLADDAKLLHRLPFPADTYTLGPGDWRSVGDDAYLFSYDGIGYSYPIYTMFGTDGRTAIPTGSGVRLAGSESVRFTVSDWWSYCDEVTRGTANLDLGTVEADGEVPTGDNVGDLWRFPVTEGDVVELSSDHSGDVEARLLLWLAGPDGCLAFEATSGFACEGAPTDMCPSLIWTADATGNVHVGVAAVWSEDEVVDYTLALHVNGAPVIPLAVEDDVTLAAIDYSLSTETAMTAVLTWTY